MAGTQSPILQPPIWTQDLNSPRLYRGDYFTLLDRDDGSSSGHVSCVISFSTYECQYRLSVPVSKNSSLIVEETFAPDQTPVQKATINRLEGYRAREVARHRGVWDLGGEGVVLFSDHRRADGTSQRVSHDRLENDEGMQRRTTVPGRIGSRLFRHVLMKSAAVFASGLGQFGA
jgi:hypothetical protein